MGPGKSRDVARKIASLPGVKVADACCGSRDVFAVVEVEESQELNKLVMDTIQRRKGLQGQAHTSPSIRSSSGASPQSELVRHVPLEASMVRIVTT